MLPSQKGCGDTHDPILEHQAFRRSTGLPAVSSLALGGSELRCAGQQTIVAWNVQASATFFISVYIQEPFAVEDAAWPSIVPRGLA